MYSRYYTYQQLSLSPSEFKQKALTWANTYRVVACYENNRIDYLYNGFENLLAVSNQVTSLVSPDDAFESLQNAVNKKPSLLCGFLSYDLKNQIEKLSSEHTDNIQFPLIYFFQPEIYFHFGESGFDLHSSEDDPEEIIYKIIKTESTPASQPKAINIEHRVNRQQYTETVRAIQQDIVEGEIYEMNYCIEFYATEAVINPLTTFLDLNAASPMPFAGFFKLEDKYLLCASPERSLKKIASKLISQPIKGTIKRSLDQEQDNILRNQLRNSEKEISENMMIMDLVRNDLSKSAIVGSVRVEEMFGIYSFQHLHQMITTVSATLKPAYPLSNALKNAFPMGSMTGAPKIRAMELIEKYERTRRGLFSGSMGYIMSNQDFDFNVIIRSLQYNSQTNYLSFMVGSAITYDSDPEQEYEECLLKASAIINILQK